MDLKIKTIIQLNALNAFLEYKKIDYNDLSNTLQSMSEEDMHKFCNEFAMYYDAFEKTFLDTINN